MLMELLDKHFIPLFLIIGFSMKLWSKRSFTDTSQRYYWLTVISTMILIIADSMEAWAQGSPEWRFWRILFSVIGYIMRPTAALSIALIIYPGQRRPRWLWIPNTVNALVYCTAFFTPDIAFGFGEKYNFMRGPLGYSAFVVSFFYIAYSVWMTWKRFRDKDHAKERYVLYLCAASCVIAVLIDMNTEGAHLNSAIMISSVFLYMFLRSIDTNRDPLTQLLNRLSFFEDCGKYGPAVSAVGSADMNGLKRLNDMVGHEAGDEALREIGRIMDELSGRNILAYRIGGDEFAMLFIRQDEETVKRVMETLKERVSEKGYSVSTGYAMREGKYASVQDLIRWADESMYANKAAFYRENGHDRRKNKGEERTDK
jgi:diguanylate cyclase (GGDEF)-like protein